MTKKSKLEIELMNLIDKNSAYEVEIVKRYLSLASTFKKLDASIKKDGVMIFVKNGSQKYSKTNPAVGEKNKVNAAMIKLGEFFDKKRVEKTDKNEVDDDEFF